MMYRKVITTGEIVDVRAVEKLHPIGEVITGVEEIDSTEILKNFDECIQPKLSKIFSEKGWDLDHKSAYNGYLEGVFWVLGKIKKKEVYG